MEVGMIHEFFLWGLSWICLYIGFGYLLSKNKKLPPGPSGWPVFGCLPLLGSMPHVTLTDLSRKYGPIVYLKMGTSKMVVANTPAAAKAFLKTLDINFSNRPRNVGATYLAYNMQDMVWAPYGDRWKILRKLCNIHMLGAKALDDWQQVREVEMGHMLKSIFVQSCKNQPVNVPDLLNICTTNIFGQMILSKRVFEDQGDEANQFKDNVVELMTKAGYFNIGDFIPSIAWMDLHRIQGSMKKLAKRFDDMLNKMIAEHQATTNGRTNPDFLDMLMSKQENFDGDGVRLSNDNIKSLLLDMFTVGTDTSSSVIEWTLSELILNPKLLKRAKDEMDDVIGRDRCLQVSDIPKLPYLVAICKEGFRKHPSTPLRLP
ncbi:hypothetical protein SUGI_0993860 [Cryptomeria japonica]|uniref:flavonoid 3',5'-hydroxylase n=1 Tax=Cryptomeria japonica TaxID=3369 RepID=UPI00241473A9|nr:flavonoid 3',5'-hydroxylase [Cryptomeria japonica]GLJ47077.1 hypothetical protein SUGI_0993860 [Cryptomeria japonica]